jgi:DNA-directed RNA polymerase subunit RPC12/RpoP
MPQNPRGVEPDAAYRCPKCGATTALLLPEPIERESHVALKCLQCAHVLRIPRQLLEGAAARLDSTSPLE